jgi:two-component system, NtrC family, sensor kinase
LIDKPFVTPRNLILKRVLLAPLITLVFICSTLIYFFAINSRNQTEAELKRISEDHGVLIDQFIHERINDLVFAANSSTLDFLVKKENLANLLDRLRAGSEAFFDIGVFDENANHLSYIGPFNLIGINYSQTFWFKEVEKKGLYVSDVFLGYRKIPHFIIAVRRAEEGRIWYLRATIDTKIFDELVENVRIGKTGEAYLVNREGVLQTNRRSGGNLMEKDPNYNIYVPNNNSKQVGFSKMKSLNGFLNVTLPLKQKDWILVTRQESREAFQLLTQALIIAGVILVLGGTLAFIIAYVMATNVSNQLRRANAEKKEMKQELFMAGRLAEVGEMSAGIAHEINNPLQVMRSEQNLMEDLITDIEKKNVETVGNEFKMIKESSQQIGIQIDRCKNIISSLMTFARKDPPTMVTLNITILIKDLIKNLSHMFESEGVKIVSELDDSLPYVVSDPIKLQQVLLNLINNSLYALKGMDKPQIKIRVFKEGSFIKILFSDNGSGVPKEILNKIFNPFFTTKPVGQGTGLGLSTVYGIIESMSGKIEVVSEVGTGTEFSIFIPIC